MYLGSNNNHLVDRNSTTFSMVYSHLQPLEHSKFVVMVYRPRSHHPLSIKLPRFRLNFLLDVERGRIECESIPNTFVDPNQSIGALHGLQNKLVLRENIRTQQADFPRIRRVLIPRGRISFRQCSGHVAVEIDTDVQTRGVFYYEYVIDLELRSLIGDGSLDSRLLKTYLHALTSYCLSDTLTGRTGLEESLHELNSAGCMSFKRLGGPEIAMLRDIRALTPRREYYPDHLKVMQTVHWNDLPAYSQAHGFEQRVIEIIEYDHHLSLFDDPVYPTAPISTVEDRRYRSPDVLYSRATAREASAFPFEVLTMSHDKLSVVDMTYVSRGLQMSHDSKHYAVARMVSLMTPESFSLTTSSPPLFDMFKSWGRLSLSPCDETAVSYTRDWLKKSDLPDTWLALYNVCRSITNSVDVKKYRLLFSLSAWLYTSEDNVRMSAIPQLVAFARHSDIFRAEPPSWKSYCLSYGTAPSAPQVSQIIKRHTCSIDRTPSSQLVQDRDESEEDWEDRRHDDYDDRVARGMSELHASIISQWPGSRRPSSPTGYNDYFEMSGLISEVRELFENCGHNSDLQNFANRIQATLCRCGVPSINNHIPTLPFNPINSLQTNRISPVSDTISQPLVDLKALFQRPAPLASVALAFDSAISPSQAVMSISGKYIPESAKQLRRVLVQFGEKPHFLHRRYAQDMQDSQLRLENEVAAHKTVSTSSSVVDFEKPYRRHKEHFKHVHAMIVDALQPRTLSDKFLSVSNRWPRITLKTILFQMTSGLWSKLSLEWKRILILFATTLLQLQQSRRLLQFSSAHKEDDLRKETQNQLQMPLHMALEHPDWLLIQVHLPDICCHAEAHSFFQIENNFLARPIQLIIAREMYSPSVEGNITLQLNMGEGKSSVIVPMVACSLADGQTLVRVVVLKSLGPQMFQLLVDRVAGLANRRVAYFPFSRQINLQSAADMTSVKSLYESCKVDASVLLVQPEHILSAKLLSIEKILVSSTDQKSRELASGALQLQRWLEENARDILDESDEELHVRYQLIYTMGLQAPIEGHPYRWTTAQQLLSLLLKNIRLLKAHISGKGTIASRVAKRLGFHYLESGALYRLVALLSLRESTLQADRLVALADEMDVLFDEDDILLGDEAVTEKVRSEPVGNRASEVAKVPALRQALLRRQRAFRRPPGLVADGRDMGTVVFPDAELKVFLTADPEIRAERRYKQLIEKGIDANLRALSRDLRDRDERDAKRAVAPLVPAPDSQVLDSSALSIDEVVERIVGWCRERKLGGPA